MFIKMIMTHAKDAKGATLADRLFWTAAGSKAPRRFRAPGAWGFYNAYCPRESGVAAALCHRSPKASPAQAGGLEEISRGLSTATPPENVAMELHSEGVPETAAWLIASKLLRPLQGRVRRQLAGGIARRLAQPPANFCQPSELKSARSPCSLRTLCPSREEKFYP